MNTPTYLNPDRVTAVRATDSAPRGDARQDGYGSKLGTRYMLQLDGKRWHRVYCVCWSNAGSLYVCADRTHLYLGSYDPREGLQS